MKNTFKHNSMALLLAILVSAPAAGETFDLLVDSAKTWQSFDTNRWRFVNGELLGSTAKLDGEITDPEASTFLVSNGTYSDDFIVSIDLTFEQGRYLGVYLDFGQDSQTGIWMASGHALDPDAPDNEVERGYIKTVEKGFWIVRATGELVIEKGRRIKLGFSRRDDTYSLWNDGKLIAVYQKKGGYPAGPLQLRLTNSVVRIHQLQVRTGKGRQSRSN
ncbi:MAG: hypothetical protein O2880_07340 [Proteobacteria bacterium]|nr:hypothetical protein [Pseudomonadota bacterium]